MSIPFIQRNYLKYHEGKGFISGHVEALHAMPPNADQFTGKIVHELIEKTGCAGIISTVSRLKVDLNRPPGRNNSEGIQEYREAIKEILEFLQIILPGKAQISRPYLHLSFHGMKDIHYGPSSMEIGTLNGKSCSSEIKNWLERILTEKAKELLPESTVVFDKKFIGDESILFHRYGDKNNYSGYGNHFHTFQIELSKTLRQKKLPQIISLFSHIILEFQKTFVVNS